MVFRLLVLIFLFHLDVIQGSYVLDIKMIEFSNPSKKLEDGQCCDRRLDGTCTDCDLKFERCFSDKKHIQSYRDCNIGRHVSKEYTDVNVVKFSSFEGRAIRRIHSPWKGYVSFVMKV